MHDTEDGRRVPDVGDGATYGVGSDCYPFTVIRVSDSGKTAWIQEDFAKRIDKGGPYTEMQYYEYSPNPDGRVMRVSHRKNGAWRPVGSDHSCVIFGARRKFRDPHF